MGPVCMGAGRTALAPTPCCFRRFAGRGAPWLFLLEAQKNRRPGLRFEPDILMADEAGRPSAQLQKIYKEGM